MATTVTYDGPAAAPTNAGTYAVVATVNDINGDFRDEIGWEELTQTVAEIYNALPANEKARAGILAGNYGEAGAINLYGGASGLPVPPEVMRFDPWAMLAAAVACLPVFLTGREIARWEGGLFLAYYAVYTTYLVLAAQRHEGAPAFGDAMLGFVLPLTIVTLGVSFLRRRS